MDLNRGPLYHVLRDPTLGPVDVDFQYLSERTGGFAETQRLGRGGFGDVYRGMSRCGDFFAVKRISQHLLGGLPEARAAAQRSYEREIVALSRFSHPQIVRLVAYSAQSGERALVYEFLPGGSLADALEDDQRAAQLTWKARTCVLRQVACALHFMHRGGAGEMCFHRDVKSANICLTATLSAKLIDCGLAMFIAVTGTGGGVLGTPAYMSPEYGRTGKCSEKAEVFSFGIVVLEVLTGK
ncbi:kinase-like domain-containing protein, partial [Ochromonadaceae sp. CCMP2298]